MGGLTRADRRLSTTLGAFSRVNLAASGSEDAESKAASFSSDPFG